MQDKYREGNRKDIHVIIGDTLTMENHEGYRTACYKEELEMNCKGSFIFICQFYLSTSIILKKRRYKQNNAEHGLPSCYINQRKIESILCLCERL